MNETLIVMSDTDYWYYRNIDLDWIVEPTDTDPGVLSPKPNAIGFEQKQDAIHYWNEHV